MLVALSACNDDNPWQYSEGEGGIAPSVTADGYVRDAIPTRSQALTPEINSFGLRLTRNDGGFAQQWTSVADFPTDKGYKSGAYTLEAFYGDVDDEGYNKPCYLGKTMFNVTPGETSEVSVTAQLANTMVDVAYTEAFRNYFESYSTTLHSEGHAYHEVLTSLNDPIYLAPGKVTVTLDFTRPGGQSAKIQPAEFTAEARHFYHITLDVNNGGVGDAVLVVKFDDTVQQEDVEIDLSDELLNLPAPEVTAKGFENGATMSVLSGAQFTGEAAYSIYAPGGLTSALLTIESDTYHPAFGNEIELIGASESLQQQLTAAGLRAIGLFKNPDQLASVDLAGFIGNLPEGNHTITLVVKDRLTRVNEPVSLSLTSSPLVLDFVSSETVAFGATTANIVVSYNSSDLAKVLTVKGLADNGAWVDCPVTAVSETTAKARRTRADEFPVKNYKVALQVPATTRDMPIKLYCNGREAGTGTVLRAMPDYTLTSNDWATRSVIKVGGYSGAQLAAITSALRFFNPDGQEIAAQYISRNPDSGEITISGLTPASHYTLSTTTRTDDNPEKGASIAFTTEAAAQPENGEMENWYSAKAAHSQTTGFGADAYVWFAKAEGASDYWATRNALTTSVNNGPTPNYVSYSGTYSVAGVSGKAAQICTEGWGEGSTFTINNGGTRKNSHAGMLFMGSHSYSGSTSYNAELEVFDYGRPFTSRPSSFSFDYTFEPYNSESFKAYAVVENRTGGKVTELARGELVSNTQVNSFTTTTVNLKYTNTSLKATHAYIVFVSSTADNPGNKNVQGSKGPFQGYTDGRRIGNILTVDNIKFNY